MKVCCMKREETGERCTNEIPDEDKICSECCELLNDYLRGTSVKQIVELQMEVDDLCSLNRRLNDILDRTANALHGSPMDKGLWSFHDLPELATILKSDNDHLRDESRRALAMIPSAVHLFDTDGKENIETSVAVSIRGILEENDKLRGLLAQGKGDCVYCSLSAADIAKCASGFPGCARMDDIVNAPDTEKDQQLLHLRMSLLNARIEVQAILDNIPNAVRVREGGGEEDVFASLAVSVAKMKARNLDENLEDLPSSSAHIDDLDMSSRLYNGLTHSGVNRLGLIAKMPEKEFGRIRNLGRKSTAEMKSILATHGMAFSQGKFNRKGFWEMIEKESKNAQ